MPAALSEREYTHICQFVYLHSRISLGDNKRELVAARLGKRMRVRGMTEYREYCDLLRSPEGSAEIESLVDVISTNHTFFFREEKHFEFLEQTVLPSFAKDDWGRSDSCLRFWSAACSSGEEPYSVAISFAKYAELRPDFFWEIDGSDICTDVLEKARQGVYPRDRLADVSPEILRRFFQRGTGANQHQVRAKADLRNRMRWHHLNLFQSSYPFEKPFHVIFCRNVMIYFDRASQEQLIARLTRQLVPGGYLMIGHSESLTGLEHGLQAIRPAVYRKPIR